MMSPSATILFYFFEVCGSTLISFSTRSVLRELLFVENPILLSHRTFVFIVVTGPIDKYIQFFLVEI